MCTYGKKDIYGQARAGVKSGGTYGERTAMEKFFKRTCIRGYHVYKEVWEVAVGVQKRAQKHF